MLPLFTRKQARVPPGRANPERQRRELARIARQRAALVSDAG